MNTTIQTTPAQRMPLVNDLIAGHCSEPLSILGQHPNKAGNGLVIRAWRPDAVAVEVIDPKSHKVLAKMENVGNGLFEHDFPRRKNPFLYMLRVHWESGHTFDVFDPYYFGQYTLKQDDVECNALYRHMGAKAISHMEGNQAVDGVLFKVFAPYARSISLVGNFNGWDERLHPMAAADDGIWRLFVPGLKAGDQYKYAIRDYHGRSLPHKTDPFATHIEQWPSLSSVVMADTPFKWSDSKWLAQRQANKNVEGAMSIYEVHLGSWRRKTGNEFLSYRELADELIPYVLEMGFSHVELLPVSEHPLFDSWGYQPVGLFAPSSRYGKPDDFRYFVDQCHKHNLGVILDWVPAHFPNDDHGLAKFDGSSLYEHPDPRRGWHPDWQTCIYDFGKPWVQDFLISNAMYWLEEFHIDGLRVDAVASMLYLDYSREHGEWEANVHGGNENLEAVAFLRRFNEVVHLHHPDVLTIAEESTSWGGVSRPVWTGGLGFDYKWNMGWMHDTLQYMGHDPVHRQYHHNEMTFSTVYAWSENFVLPLSHDEVVHGKGTILTRMPGDEWQRFANLRAYYGFMFGHPGKKLLFMGSEFGTYNEWNVNQSLDWHILDNEHGNFCGVQKLVKRLNELHRDIPALHQRDLDNGGFAWTTHDDAGQSVLAFRRYDRDGKVVHVVTNLTPVVRHDYRIGVHELGEYEVILNSDDMQFGGSGVAVGGEQLYADEYGMHYLPYSLSLNLPPLATVMIVKK